VSNDFILTYVVPKIRPSLDDAAALVFGKAILWGAFDSNEFLMPANL
jgi:hypothetical protein